MPFFFRAAFLVVACCVASSSVRAEDLDLSKPPFPTPSQLGADADELYDAFKTLHPGIYRYLSPLDLDREFAVFKSSMERSQTERDAFLAVARFSSAIKCGHTWTNPLNQPDSVSRDILEREDRLPIHFRVVGRRFLVTQISGTSSVEVNDEITAIDGVPVSHVIERLWPFLRADGASDGKRLAQIGHEGGQSAFDLYYSLLAPPQGHERTLQLRRLGMGSTREVRVSLVSEKIRESALQLAGGGGRESWSYEVNGDTAKISMPTWAFWNKPFDWQAWMNQVFADLRTKKIRFLIIDLRANEGGDGAIGDVLAAHLSRTTHRYRSHIPYLTFDVVPDRLRPDLSTWDPAFYDLRPVESPVSPGKFTLLDADPEWVTVSPTDDSFDGSVFILIGPSDSSATYEFARVMRETHIATLIGRPTGGNLRGINGSKMFFLRLHHSKISVDLPLVAWTAREPVPDASVSPDIEVAPNLVAVASGEDPDLDRVYQLTGELRK